MRTVIMVAVFRNSFFWTTIMVTVLYIPVFAFSKQSAFFEAIIAGHLHLLPLRSTWAHVVSLKKEMVEANKIMKLTFFLITI